MLQATKNKYTVETLKPLNILYDHEHRLTQQDVDMANGYVELIERTRSEKIPQVGDRLIYVDRYGKYYGNALIEKRKNTDGLISICEIPYIPFIWEEYDGIGLSVSGGSFHHIDPLQLKFVRWTEGIFQDWGNCGACANGAVAFTAKVPLWSYSEPDLFLDEVGTLSMEVQSMLLRTLQEGTYIPIGSNREKHSDVRIVAATNEDLQLAIRERRFREDLYHRLGEFEIVLPALHECPEDILPLAEHFREKFSRELKRQTDGFSREAEQLLLSYGWPGNVRELQNKVKRAVLLSKQPIIESACLNIRIEDEEEGIFLFPENETQEKLSIIRALKICTGNRKRTAEMLHIDPSTLYRKMKKYGLNDK